MGKDYYTIMGVPRTATEDDLRKAYRKLALEFHPDRNKDPKAKEKFQELSEAFEVLSDSNKRAVYDQFGEEGLKGVPRDAGGDASGFSGFPFGGGMPGGATFSFTTSGGGGGGGKGGFRPSNPEEIFKHFFSQFGNVGGMSGGAGGMGGLDDDLFFGSSSGGSGGSHIPASAMFGKNPRRGHSHHGGVHGGVPYNKVVSRDLPVTLEELYKGGSRKLKVTRKDLHGVVSEKILTVDIKPGWRSGVKVKFHEEGDALPNSTNQDIEFVICEKPHAQFQRDGDDLHMNLDLTLCEALTGFSKTVNTLDGRKLKISFDQIVLPDQEVRFQGEGMPIKGTSNKGDLVIKYKVHFPTSLTLDQKNQLKAMLMNVR
ncbi:hypothetical protein HMI54_006614 [Coelomomyces lativittatus]|nr:hypothetical protein HMI55_002208 [Coelomomyces lativittatus]KAJ1504786.1 hypothetical protein HMI54_006614 [Coelomomyces lativittatus]KAJ1515657.1 hypothetical protein HMI56_002670 [Coelomomyces lativittatus]